MSKALRVFVGCTIVMLTIAGLSVVFDVVRFVKAERRLGQFIESNKPAPAIPTNNIGHDWPWIVSNAWIAGFKAGSEATIEPYSQYLVWCLQNGGKTNREKALEFLNIVDAQMTNNPFTSENAARFGH